MDIRQFISGNSVDQCKALINREILELAEKQIGLSFGEELTEYLLKYGYLGYEYIELYGINANQGLKSDMVTQTEYLHKYFPLTKSFIALENQGEGDYYIVNGKDEVYEYISEQNKLVETGLSLFEYILNRFQNA